MEGAFRCGLLRCPVSSQVSTLIGYGSPNKADTHDVHGAPLGKDETAATRKNLKWNYGEFEVRCCLACLPACRGRPPHVPLQSSPYLHATCASRPFGTDA